MTAHLEWTYSIFVAHALQRTGTYIYRIGMPDVLDRATVTLDPTDGGCGCARTYHAGQVESRNRAASGDGGDIKTIYLIVTTAV